MNIIRNSSSFQELNVIEFCREKHFFNRIDPLFDCRFENIQTPIFRHGPPSINDISQGGAKDCIFLSLSLIKLRIQ
jgi:hypothetical protein